MKIFQKLRIQYAILGVSASHQLTQQSPINKRILFVLVLFVCFVLSQFVYLRAANNFMDFMDCISTMSGGIIMFVCFVAIVCRKATLFESIKSIEKLIGISENYFYVTIDYNKSANQIYSS